MCICVYYACTGVNVYTLCVFTMQTHVHMLCMYNCMDHTFNVQRCDSAGGMVYTHSCAGCVCVHGQVYMCLTAPVSCQCGCACTVTVQTCLGAAGCPRPSLSLRLFAHLAPVSAILAGSGAQRQWRGCSVPPAG